MIDRLLITGYLLMSGVLFLVTFAMPTYMTGLLTSGMGIGFAALAAIHYVLKIQKN